MAFKIKLAGIEFQVNGIYEESLKKHCGDYLDIEENSDNKKCFDNCGARKEDLKLSDNDSVYEIIISEDDIIREQGTMLEDEGQSGFAPEYLETLALLRKVAEVLPEKDGFLMHGAVIVEGQSLYVYCTKWYRKNYPHQVMEEVFRSGCFYYKWGQTFY